MSYEDKVVEMVERADTREKRREVFRTALVNRADMEAVGERLHGANRKELLYFMTGPRTGDRVRIKIALGHEVAAGSVGEVVGSDDHRVYVKFAETHYCCPHSEVAACLEAVTVELPFVPTPAEVGRTDDDCATLIWRRGQKRLVLNLNCYGGIGSVNCYGGIRSVKCGLREPPVGIAKVGTFEEGWAWFCNESPLLPEELK